MSRGFLLRPDVYILGGVALALYLFGMWKDKLPSTAAIRDIVNILDSKGGNILILVTLMMYFFHRTEQFYYAVTQLIAEGKIANDNGVALNALLFCTGAFGSVLGAFLKATTGTDTAMNSSTTITKTEVPEKA